MSGGNGYVGNYILKQSALRYPQIMHYAMSRRGELREGDNVVSKLDNVKALKGNCLHPETYPEELKEVDAIIHSVGALIDSKNPEKSYKALNRDSCINLA